MKKITVFVMVMVLAGGLISACGKNEEESRKTVRQHDYYKVTDDSEEDLAALFFLGCGQEEIEKTAKELLNKYNMTEEEAAKVEYETVKVDDGSEHYLIVPKYEGSTIQVHSVKLNDQGNLQVDKELLLTDKPVVVQCNISDIVPSAQITVTSEDKSVVFNPAISLKDGNIVKIEGVFTE
ncbi:hypothetical protein [Aminipila sp.]|uniref:hypothetical protein n=1 Tax=Aminipila sp. TaxID=2060095 RepID=UPI00289E9B7B|nr:hypothetical protein [Aminipila sp.]